MSEEKSLKNSFNGNHTTSKYGDSVLLATSGKINHFYDFTARVLLTRADWGTDYNITTTPFSQLDRDTLVAARDRLVELGGTPPALLPEPNTLNKPVRGLNP